MNAWEVLEAMKNGAKFSSRYKPNPIGKPKRVYQLIYPDGKVVKLQASILTPLYKDHRITSTEWSGGFTEYKVFESIHD